MASWSGGLQALRNGGQTVALHWVLLGFFFVNRKHHFFSGLCLVETTNKRGSTQLEMIDAQKGNIFLPSRYILGGEK